MKETFWPFLAEARAKAFMEATIKSAFACTGIWPLNRVKVLKKIPTYDPTRHFMRGKISLTSSSSESSPSHSSGTQQPTPNNLTVSLPLSTSAPSLTTSTISLPFLPFTSILPDRPQTPTLQSRASTPHNTPE
ncbi:hypothetical protein L873DRAFT_1766168 [Choiromyces venosus 120613-1]|uniref:Uncharacterized protein n=1 Tax=Choiromyces venosus 120613-1 TaxID=1336337 RepID=A0A3N4JQJ6_9PEZI|nr:hypothetical protein L873DRAFT_1766168 [Choiromyces venosus 120613-1]